MVVVLSLAGGFVGSHLAHDQPAPVSGAVAPAPVAPSPVPVPSPTPSTVPTTPPSSAPAPAGATSVPAGIVDIETSASFSNQEAAGTGMVLTADGDVLTNNHVVEGATDITVIRTDTGDRYAATIVGVDPVDDIALLHLVDAANLPTIPLGESSTVAIGDPVVAAGNAGGRGGAPTVVTGIVQALHQTIQVAADDGGEANTLRDLIQTSAPLEPGDSGGPMFNADQEVIGVNTAASSARRFNAGSSEGFAIPIDDALAIVKQIRTGVEKATIHIGVRGFLGVATADALGGARVTSVEASSPAERGGVAVGDLMIAVDGSSVGSVDQLTELIHAHQPGDRVQLTWTASDGSSHTAAVTLATGAAD